MIPIFRYRSSVVCRAIVLPQCGVLNALPEHHLPFRTESAVMSVTTIRSVETRAGTFRRSNPGAPLGRRLHPSMEMMCVTKCRAALPAIVREGLVGFRHLVRVFALLDRAALVARRRQDLGRE